MDQSVKEKLEYYKFLPRFKSLALEQEFRASFLDQDKSLARFIYFGAIFVALISIIPDTLSNASQESLYGLHISTFVFLLFNIASLRMLASTTQYRYFDLIATAWWLVVIAAISIGNTLYPPGLIIHTVFDIMIPVAIYLLIPVGLITQCLLALLFTAANLGILIMPEHNLSDIDSAFIFLAYLTAHFLGLIACWQIHLGRRKQYGEQKTEQFLKVELQKTIDELKILRGIIPICSYCKQIRDDEGFWHQVESYIKRHSEADFTHGICPGCMQDHFPKEYKIMQENKQKPGLDET